MMPSATEIRDTDLLSPPLPAVPRRVQELKNGSHTRSKAHSTKSEPKDPRRRRHARRWREKVISGLDAESFNSHVAILKILRRIPELKDHVPQLASNNPVARTYTLKYPDRDLVPFEREARFKHLSYQEIQRIKSQLYRSVRVMYNNGVGYNIYPHELLLRGSYYTPMLFLGSVTSSNLLDKAQLDWKEQRDGVCAQIDRVFAPIEIWAFQEEAADPAKDAREEMDKATSIINDENPAIDTAKADLTEARAIMAEAYQAIKNARAAIEGVNSISKEIYASVIRPQGAWERAHWGKEYAETSRKKTKVLKDRANTLIQKYGNAKPNNGVVTGDAMPHPETQSGDNVEMPNSNLPADAAKTVERSIPKDGAVTDETSLGGDGRSAT